MDIEFINHSNRFRKKQLKFKHSGDIEPHEAFLYKLAQKREEEIGMADKKFEVPLSGKSLKVFFILIIFLIIFLFAKTFQLQVVDGKDYLARAQDNKYIVSKIHAERGVIYDKNMNQLVYNKPSFDLILNKLNLPESEEEKTGIFREVSQILGIGTDDLKNMIDKSKDYSVLISADLSHESLIILETKIKDYPGFEVRQDWVRDYKDGQYFSQAIGYMGKITSEELVSSPDYSILDWIGRAGLEKTYENILKKNPGKMQIERDALGKEISRQITEDPQSGNNLVLWMDSELQKKITEVLGDILKTVGSEKAAAVALDPKTGGVLSLVSVPTFDNNLFNKGADQKALSDLINDPQQSLYNLAIGGQFPSGSTIKPLIASAALQENLISSNKQINCQGKIVIQSKYDPEIIWEYEDLHIHGLTDVRKALAESCNVFFYTIGGGYQNQRGLGPTLIKKYLELFGWGQKTQIDIPGEVKGLIPSPSWKESVKGESWWDGDTYNMSIGQGDVLVTPIQMAASFLPIANGGKLLKPQLVQKIIDSEKNIIETTATEVVRENFIDAYNLQVVREGMRSAVTGYGAPQASAVSLNSLPVDVAAKTGTAETGRMANGASLFNNWITVFAPYDNPQIVLTILIKDVPGIRGATVPAAKSILEWYFTEGGGTGAQQ